MLVLPEKDVIGNIIKSRDTSIGIAVAVFVVIALVASGLIIYLLRPLDEVAQRMYWAATFRDTAEPLQKSAIEEIYALQHAYEAMNKQLVLVKCFLPANLLHTDADDLEEAIEAAATEGEMADAKAKYSEGGKKSEGRATAKTGSGKDAAGDGTESVASHRSLRSDASKRATAVVGAAHVGLSVTKTSVSIVAANLQGLHQHTTRWNSDDILRTFSDVVSVIEKLVLDHRGVVDFHGDHFYATFNSVRPCVNHAVRAMACCRRAARRDRIQLSTPAFHRYCDWQSTRRQLGLHQPEASLHRRARVHAGDGAGATVPTLRANVLVTGTTGEGQTNVFVQVVDAARLPGSEGLTTIAAVHSRTALIEVATQPGAAEEKNDGEWMYEMAAGVNSCHTVFAGRVANRRAAQSPGPRFATAIVNFLPTWHCCHKPSEL